jgi:hypothetical protein
MAKTGPLADQIVTHQGACVTFSSRVDLHDLTAWFRTDREVMCHRCAPADDASDA